jgi:apolipoprotein N-acyltransferase
LARPIRYAVLLAGALPVLAFPGPNLEWLAWFGLVPGLLLIRSAPTAREAVVRGCWFGAGYLLAALYWLAPNIGPALLLVAIVMGALWSCVGLATWKLLRPPVTARRALAALVVVPSCWVLTEWIRSWRALGGPWAVLGAAQWQHPVILALAALGGVWLISFALVVANTGLVVALVAARTGVRVLGAACAAVAVAAGPVAFALTAGSPVTGHVTIGLVQPGIVASNNQRIAVAERMTAADAGHAELIVWGESSVSDNLGRTPALLTALERLSQSAGAQLLVNQDSVSPQKVHSKVAILLGPSGVEGSYIKTRLVPFGEYIPFRGELGWLTSISKAAAENMLPGTGAHVLHATLPDGRPLPFGVLICFESAFPDMSRYDADHGAQVIIYQTSDATFQHSWGPAQHASLSALRAAETGRPVVQAALTGDSVAFDPRGRLIAWAGTSFRGVLNVRIGLPPGSARTLYDRLQDYVPWTATAIAILAALTGLYRRARDRRNGIRAAGPPAVVLDDISGPDRLAPDAGLAQRGPGQSVPADALADSPADASAAAPADAGGDGRQRESPGQR